MMIKEEKMKKKLETMRKIIEKMTEEGMTVSEISEAMNIPAKVVFKVGRIFNIQLKFKKRRGEKEWKKLTKNKNYGGRIISLPFRYLERLGFGRDDELYGKWVLNSNGLKLVIKRKEEIGQIGSGNNV